MIADANIFTFLYSMFFLFFLFVHLSMIFWLILKKKNFFETSLQFAKIASFSTICRLRCLYYFGLDYCYDIAAGFELS